MNMTSNSSENLLGGHIQSTSDIRDFRLQGTGSAGPNDFLCNLVLKQSVIKDLDIKNYRL